LIRTYRYGGQKEVEKDGQKATIQIPPPAVLAHMGPVIQVSITHPRIIQEQIKLQNKEVPGIQVNALIDTGASNSVVTPKIADSLNLVHTGFQKVASVHDEQDRPVYYGFIIFPWGSGKEIPLVACALKNFDCLLGRDILRHWHFTYHGTDGSIVICD
jgi:predicted aspartyl protease